MFHRNEEILNFNKTILCGFHNYENALVTLAISDAMQFSRKKTIYTISNFKSLPHRFQIVCNDNNISWINDSKSTNVDNTKTAIKNINTTGTIRLLLGGDSKYADFNVLKKHFHKIKIKIYCFGKDGYKLTQIFQKKAIYFNTLQNAMKFISKEVIPGDVVLLSPGCSSKDQFVNFEERGDLFIKLSKEINT